MFIYIFICYIINHIIRLHIRCNKFINNICRWGNFNNIRILQKFPKPSQEIIDNYYNTINTEDNENENKKIIYNYFNITEEEILFLEQNM